MPAYSLPYHDELTVDENSTPSEIIVSFFRLAQQGGRMIQSNLQVKVERIFDTFESTAYGYSKKKRLCQGPFRDKDYLIYIKTKWSLLHSVI